jgi:DNA-binding response OmpR family regulator
MTGSPIRPGLAKYPVRAAEPFAGENRMSYPSKTIVLDIDPASLVVLREAFSEWEVEVIHAATTDSLARHWNPEPADLFVIGARHRPAVTLGLCRVLRSWVGHAHTPLLVLVPPGQGELVRALLRVGAHSCLILPIHAKELVSKVARARAGNWPGRHTLSLDQAQRADLWRDCGGEG